MSFPILYDKVRELAATAQAMGALGAELRLRQFSYHWRSAGTECIAGGNRHVRSRPD